MEASETPHSDPASGPVESRSVRRASLVAGVSLVLMIVFAMFGNFVVLEGLVTPGDAAQTATDVTNDEETFRFGIVSLLLVAVLDVFVAWGLYVVFAPASRTLSALAAWFRLVYAGIFVVAISQLAGALRLLKSPEYLDVYTTQQLEAQALARIETFHDVWSAGLLLFGVHLLVLGYLAYRAEYVSPILGLLLAIAGLGYVVDSIDRLLAIGLPLEIATVTFVGEVVLIVWLFVWGSRLDFDDLPASPTD